MLEGLWNLQEGELRELDRLMGTRVVGLYGVATLAAQLGLPGEVGTAGALALAAAVVASWLWRRWEIEEGCRRKRTLVLLRAR